MKVPIFIDPNCPICHGSGKYNPDGITIRCPLCEEREKSKILLHGIQDIANYAIGHHNQPFIREFHKGTIKIAQMVLNEYIEINNHPVHILTSSDLNRNLDEGS